MENKKLNVKIGDVLFKYRSFTPIPLIIIVLVFFKPGNYGDIANILITLAGILISIIGELIRIMSVGFSYFGTSGRENYLRAENLNISGIYSIVRNPLYIGNVLMFSGLLIVYLNIYALGLFVFFLLIQYHFIIKSEENYLKGMYKDEYANYCKNTKSIFPKFSKFVKPELYFNLKKIIFKENDSIFNMAIMFIILLALREKAFSIYYIIIISVFVMIYILIKIWKKKGNIDITDRRRK